MTTSAPFFNLKIKMDQLAAYSSLCSGGDGDDNDDMVYTPIPASPTVLVTSEQRANDGDKKILTTSGSTAQRMPHENNKISHLNGSNSSESSNSIKNNISSSPLSHNNKIRLLYFFFRFSTGSLVPFMSLYMQYVGLRPDQIGTLQAIRPIVTMASAPLWGGLADRTGRKKMVLVVSSKISTFAFCISPLRPRS